MTNIPAKQACAPDSAACSPASEFHGQAARGGRKERATGGAPLCLFDPRRGDAAFRLTAFDADGEFSRPQRTNYFTVLWIREGEGRYYADLSEHQFAGPALLFANPYQTFFLRTASQLQGRSLQFHANFFCIETHHHAVGCNGVLFNDPYGQPFVQAPERLVPELERQLEQMEQECRIQGLAHTEALISHLKLFLISATRLKLEQRPCEAGAAPGGAPAVLDRLKQLIEEHYRTRHSPAEYASALHMTPKALGKLVKAHLGKTLTELIRERLLNHAKWQLLHTRRSVKEIAWEVGFADELYFSRLFKRAAGCSPTSFREFETAVRGGRNLSM